MVYEPFDIRHLEIGETRAADYRLNRGGSKARTHRCRIVGACQVTLVNACHQAGTRRLRRAVIGRRAAARCRRYWRLVDGVRAIHIRHLEIGETRAADYRLNRGGSKARTHRCRIVGACQVTLVNACHQAGTRRLRRAVIGRRAAARCRRYWRLVDGVRAIHIRHLEIGESRAADYRLNCGGSIARTTDA